MTSEAAQPSSEYRIRRADHADEVAILALVPRLVDFGPPPWRDAKSMSATDRKVIEGALRSTDGDTAVLVAATASNEVAAFIHLKAAMDYYTERKHGHVADMVVAKEHEGRGLARTLLATAEEWARGKGYEWLSIGVFEENTRAAALYERVGFRRDIVKMLKPLR